MPPRLGGTLCSPGHAGCFLSQSSDNTETPSLPDGESLEARDHCGGHLYDFLGPSRQLTQERLGMQ